MQCEKNGYYQRHRHGIVINRLFEIKAKKIKQGSCYSAGRARYSGYISDRTADIEINQNKYYYGYYEYVN